jgi:hypothetical protein
MRMRTRTNHKWGSNIPHLLSKDDMANKTIYVKDEQLWSAFKQYADNQHTSMSDLLERMIRDTMQSRRQRIMRQIRCEGK